MPIDYSTYYGSLGMIPLPDWVMSSDTYGTQEQGTNNVPIVAASNSNSVSITGNHNPAAIS